MKTILNKKELRKRSSKIRYFFCDVDGTLTDGNTYYSANGEELKKFSHIDGTGFMLLRNIGVESGFITGENTPIVLRRAEKLNINYCFMGVNDKVEVINKFTIENNCTLNEIAYIGDDLNDLNLISQVGLSFAVGNAHNLLKKCAHICCKSTGGDGAFREAIEIFLSIREYDLKNVFVKI